MAQESLVEESAMKIRIKFSKYGVMKYVGHLDMMRFFQKAMRRAFIPIAYSEGFSPHQIMSFAAPLGVGMESQGEYMDIEVTSMEGMEGAIKRLQETMVEGIEIQGLKKLPESEKSAMSQVKRAAYWIGQREGTAVFQENFFSQKNLDEKLKEFYMYPGEIIVTKQTKRSEKIIDIKPMIYKMEVLKEGIYMEVAAGSTENIKPTMVLKEFCSFHHIPYEEKNIQIIRIDLYTEKDGMPISLGETGEIL